MIRYLRTIVLALVLLFAGSGQAFSQAASGVRATDAVVAMDAPTQTAGETSSGLPAQAAPPRTLRAHWHVYLAFAATWLLLFGYTIWLGRRFGRLEEEIRQVRNV